MVSDWRQIEERLMTYWSNAFSAYSQLQLRLVSLSLTYQSSWLDRRLYHCPDRHFTRTKLFKFWSRKSFAFEIKIWQSQFLIQVASSKSLLVMKLFRSLDWCKTRSLSENGRLVSNSNRINQRNHNVKVRSAPNKNSYRSPASHRWRDSKRDGFHTQLFLRWTPNFQMG